MAETQLFGRNDDEAALAAIESALTATYPNEDVASLMNVVRRRPLLRMIVLANVRQEIRAADRASANGQIDWGGLADFLTKIAPLIFELLKMFM